LTKDVKNQEKKEIWGNHTQQCVTAAHLAVRRSNYRKKRFIKRVAGMGKEKKEIQAGTLGWVRFYRQFRVIERYGK